MNCIYRLREEGQRGLADLEYHTSCKTRIDYAHFKVFKFCPYCGKEIKVSNEIINIALNTWIARNNWCDGCKYDEDRFSDICYHDCIQFSDYELKQYPAKEKQMENKFKPNGYDNDGNAIQYGFGGEYKPMKDKVNNCIDNDPSTTKWENKVIFENEEQFDKFMDDCFNNDWSAKRCKEKAKDKGYIRKSVGKLKGELYNQGVEYLRDQSRDVNIDQAISDIERYVQYLKAENERLKK